MNVEDFSSAVWKEYGMNRFVDPTARMSVRERKEELDLGNLVVDYYLHLLKVPPEQKQ